MPKREWSDEPPAPRRRRGQYDWFAITADLKKHPGQWTCIDKEARPWVADAVRLRKMTALQDPEWEWDVMTTKNDTKAKTCELHMSAVKREG